MNEKNTIYRTYLGCDVGKKSIVVYDSASGKTHTVGNNKREILRFLKAYGGDTFVVRVRRLGEVVLPVEVELQFEGGPPERRDWDGRDRWVSYEVTRPYRLVAAVVDPDDRLVLDVNRLNNARRVRPDGQAAAYWGARVTFWLQSVLALVGL